MDKQNELQKVYKNIYRYSKILFVVDNNNITTKCIQYNNNIYIIQMCNGTVTSISIHKKEI